MCQNEARKKETIVKISNAIIGAGLYVVACSATALSLGSSRGTVVLGAPIDLAFEVVPDPDSDVASSCISARLVSGANPIAESKIHVSPLVGSRTPMVRVQAFVPADEPVLTATLTAGCSGKITRNYTFLAELPDTVSSANRPVDITRLANGAVPAASVPDVSALPLGSAAPASNGRSPRAATRDGDVTPAVRTTAASRAARPRADVAVAPQAASVATPARTRAVAATAPQAPKSRLVMEPLELWLDSPVPLRSSSELATPSAATTEAQRAEAAAWWKALNTSPEDVQAASARVGKLEADVAAQRAQASSERAAAADLKQRLETVESQSFSATVVYALLALLLLALGLVVWIWNRSRREVTQAWHHSVAINGGLRGGVVVDGVDGEEALHTAPHPNDVWDESDVPLPPVAPPPPIARPPAPVVPKAVPSRFAEVNVPVPAPAPVAVAAAVPVPAAVAGRTAQIVPPEELFDIQQQAEFFVSVGEHDQAIGVLKKHIADHGNVSPSAYLELLRLYHTLSRPESFNQLRAQFHQQFNASVPEFSAFHRMGRTLDDYPDALAAIEAQWSAPEVTDLIEGYLFRRVGEVRLSPFDLAAYDDLLMLLAIASTTPPSLRGAPPPRQRTTPLATTAQQGERNFAILPHDALISAPPPPATGKKLEAPSLDSLMGDLTLESLSAPLAARPVAAPPRDVDFDLDLDLSDPPALTTSDLPPVPVTRTLSPGQPVGFGLVNDKLEVRLELEEMRKRKPGEE